jgi:hypothetical protein
MLSLRYISGGGVPGSASASGTASASASHLSGSGSSLHAPPRRLLLSLYERTFFSDNKMGDLDLPLTALTDDRYHNLIHDS